jgi:hypothetical protein
MDDMIFRRNLLALSARHQGLCDTLSEAVADPRLRIERSRTGQPVPVLQLPGRAAAFHSLMDPVREAERLAGTQAPGGFIVSFGLGAGYAIRSFLASPKTTAVVAIEYSAPLLRALLEVLDLSEIFLDRRFTLALDPTPEELGALILSSYVPPVSGDIRTAPLRGRTDLEPEPFALAADTLRAILGRISDDYSVQAFFGKLWFRNAVRNLFASEGPTPPLPPVRRAIVTAAGPSLEEGIGEVARAQAEGAFLIATDTTLPALLGYGLRPGAVVSIDCQTISYYHFLKGLPSGLPLVLDLASPNRLARLSDSPRFFSSGHPFCAYVSSNYRPFPALDTSGGNVTHAALSLAEALGAETCLLVGADFSYPEGKSYARGTYIYDYFDGQASRLSPSESLFTGFVRRNASIVREMDRDGEGRDYCRYVTKPLMAYKEHLERFIERSSMETRPLRGKGVEIHARRGGSRQGRMTSLFSAGPASESAASFLRRYALGLAALPPVTGQASAYLSSLGLAERDLWTTLLPSASALRRAAGLGTAGGGPDKGTASNGADAAALLEETRAWALAELESALEVGETLSATRQTRGRP